MSKAYYGGVLVFLATVVALAATGPSRNFQKVDNDRVVALGYRTNQTDTAYRSTLSAASSHLLTDTAGGIGAVTTLTCGGWATVSVSGLHSVASATVVVHFYRCTWDGTTLTVVGHSKGTLTAEATFTNGVASTFPSAQSLGFDTEGCDVAKVLIEAPSSGNVSLFASVY